MAKPMPTPSPAPLARATPIDAEKYSELVNGDPSARFRTELMKTKVHGPIANLPLDVAIQRVQKALDICNAAEETTHAAATKISRI